MTRAWPAALLPLALFGLLAAAFLLRPLDWLTSNVPPIETLTVERVQLGPASISVRVRPAARRRSGSPRSRSTARTGTSSRARPARSGGSRRRGSTSRTPGSWARRTTSAS